MKLSLLAIRSGLALLAFAVLFAAGCRTPPGQTLLERENYQQEKTIEELKDQVEDAEQELAHCRRENSVLKGQHGGGSIAIPSTDSPRILTPPPDSGPTSPPPNIPLFQPPKIDRGTESPPDDSPARPSKSQPEQWSPPKAAPRLDPLDRTSPDSGATTSSYQEEESPSAARLSLIRLLTNGHQFGGHGSDSYSSGGVLGDNGVQVAFSPRDAENRPVPIEGSVALVVVDPALSGPEARVARWDFSPDEAKAHFRQTLFGKAYRFDLLWPHDAPQHERLKLFVRLTTPDGQRLEAQQTIHVKLGTLTPAVDNSDFADSPAPHNPLGSEPVRSQLIRSELIRSEQRPRSPSADTDAYEPDEPAPHGSEPSVTTNNALVHNGAVWRPYR